jgi:hypothetical protein
MRTRSTTRLGSWHAMGQGVPQDWAEAARLYRRAADQRLADAQLALGARCVGGEGVPQDWTEAARLFRRAADQGGCADALFNLRVCFATGRGVPQDWEEAARLHRRAAGRAADQGLAGAVQPWQMLQVWRGCAAGFGGSRAPLPSCRLSGSCRGAMQRWLLLLFMEMACRRIMRRPLASSGAPPIRAMRTRSATLASATGMERVC